MLPIHALAVLVACVTVQDVPNPRHAGRWVTDMVGVIDAPSRERMEALAGELNRDLGVEVAVVTVQDVDGVPRDFATALFNHWRIGKGGADNGLLVLMVMGRRRLEMETGYGLEPILTDGWLGVMQAQVMVPQFKAGKVGVGLVAGLERVDAELRAHAQEAREGTRRQRSVFERAERVADRAADDLGFSTLLGMVVLGGAGTFVLVRRRRRRAERTCPRCKNEMELLPEHKEDAHLTRGQQAEERVGSILYDVFFCRDCNIPRVVARRKMFSRYQRCPSCSSRTLESDTRTIHHATYDHEGEVAVSERCRNCTHRNDYRRTTPRRERPTHVHTSSDSGWSSSSDSSSSSSSSDFGGGSSGGGGAGSDW